MHCPVDLLLHDGLAGLLMSPAFGKHAMSLTVPTEELCKHSSDVHILQDRILDSTRDLFITNPRGPEITPKSFLKPQRTHPEKKNFFGLWKLLPNSNSRKEYWWKSVARAQMWTWLEYQVSWNEIHLIRWMNKYTCQNLNCLSDSLQFIIMWIWIK